MSEGGRPSMPTPQTSSKWTGTIGEAPTYQRLRTHLDGQELWRKPQHARASGPTKMDRSYRGTPSMPAPQDPPQWTEAMGEHPSCRRLRTHRNGQEQSGKPGMPTLQDPPVWTGAMGEGQSPGHHPDVSPTSPSPTSPGRQPYRTNLVYIRGAIKT